MKRLYFRNLFKDLFNGFEVNGKQITLSKSFTDAYNGSDLYVYCSLDEFEEYSGRAEIRNASFHILLRINNIKKDIEEQSDDYMDALIELLSSNKYSTFENDDGDKINSLRNDSTFVLLRDNEIIINSLIVINYIN